MIDVKVPEKDENRGFYIEIPFNLGDVVFTKYGGEMATSIEITRFGVFVKGINGVTIGRLEDIMTDKEKAKERWKEIYERN